MHRIERLIPILFIAGLLWPAALPAEDWPQWRGPNRDGVWRDTGILTAIPSTGLNVRWRAKIGAGYSGPVVAQGRVFVTDHQFNPEVERVVCFEETTGKPLWTHSYPCDYHNMEYGNGPRASPTVLEGKVYTLGTRGHLFCLDAASGDVIWKKDLAKDLDAHIPRYGASPAPLVAGDLLITCLGGKTDATVIALDKNTGDTRWKALSDRPAYSSPILITAGGTEQLIVWTADNVNSLEPSTGKSFWQVPYKTTFDEAQVLATPVLHKDRLLCLTAWDRGSFMLKLDSQKPAATVLWKTRSKPTTTISTPLFQNDNYFYAVLADGSLACLDANTGNEVWSTREPTSEKFGNAHLTANGDKVFLFNQKGHLILARLTPQGYRELGRALLVEPTAGFRAGNPVAWAHPAYANQHVFARNDRELVCASLAAAQAPPADAAELAQTANSRVLEATAGPEETLALSLAISPEGKTLALGSGWGSIKLLELSTGKVLPSPPNHEDWVCSVVFSPDGKLLISAGGSEFAPARLGNKPSAELKLWDVAAQKALPPLTGHTNKIFAAAFAPDARTLATGSADRTVRLWDVATWKERAVLEGHTDAVLSVAFSPDSRIVASAGADHVLKLWDASTGKALGDCIGHEEAILAVAIARDGKTLATGSADCTVRLWDLESKHQRVILRGHQGAVYSLAFSPDGHAIASGSGDQTIKLWDLVDGKDRMTLRGHRSGVSAVSFTPDGRSLVSAALDDPVRVWELAVDK